MDTRNGNLYLQEQVEKMLKNDPGLKKYMREAVAITPEMMKRLPPKVGRNEPCPCGSGAKFKKCCYRPQTSGE